VTIISPYQFDRRMTDARKYRKMAYLVMLRKVKKWSWIYIRNRIDTEI